MEAELTGKTAAKSILALNSGSSSLKFGLFAAEGAEIRSVYSGQADALEAISKKLSELSLRPVNAVGHRIVHGGPKLFVHQRITPEVLRELELATHFAPLHMPAALRLIHAAEKRFPGVPQFACFDTAFHRTMPEVAARLPLPEEFWKAGIRRYGFHGISCESVLHSLGADVPARMVVAHLGNGASVTAIANGASVDTTMGLTPTGGVVMGTRTGDLDPGILLHLLRTEGSSVDQLETLLDQQSGLLGISGISKDMRDLHAAKENARAALAIEIFCRGVAKAVAGLICVLGGLDLLVFTGGIGENDAIVREKICSVLRPFNISDDSNASGARPKVIHTEEEAQIARHCLRLLGGDL